MLLKCVFINYYFYVNVSFLMYIFCIINIKLSLICACICKLLEAHCITNINLKSIMLA